MFVNLRKKLQRDTVSGQKSFNGTNPQVDGGHRNLTEEQEETFSWTVRSKDNELTVLRNERDALTQQVTVLEANWQTKLARVTADFEQMLELARLENTKVKHLLLNTQSELEAANVRVAELESKLKNNHDDHVREETVKLAQQQTEITSLRKQLEDLTRTLSNGHSN